jgi:EmrB/QacA subfamily drug resistance transporter
VDENAGDRALRGRRWWILATLATGTLLGAFNNSSASAVLPVIREDFRVPVAAVQWVVVVFMLVSAGTQLTFGRLGDLYGHRRLYLGGLAIQSAGYLLAGTAPSLGWLIAARFIQAVGAAMVIVVAPVVMTLAFPPQQRGRLLGLQGTTVFVGLALGPSIGGLITDRLGWRAIFLLCLPLAGLTALLAWRHLADFRLKARDGRFDFLGSLLFAVGLTALIYALTQAPAAGWLSPLTLGLLALGGATLAAFTAWERRYPAPMLDLALFRIRMFRVAALSSVINFICFFGVLFLMPFYLIAARGWTAGEAGLVFMVMPVTMAVLAPLSGWASDRVGSRALSSAAMVGIALGLVSLGLLDAAAPTLRIVLSLVLIGLGLGSFSAPNSSALLGAAPPERRGIASGVVGTARSTGMMLGVALTGALFTAFLAAGGGSVEAGGPPLFAAIRWTFWTLAGVALLGAALSYSRGAAQPIPEPDPGAPAPEPAGARQSR